jgi:hypothetical protein
VTTHIVTHSASLKLDMHVAAHSNNGLFAPASSSSPKKSPIKLSGSTGKGIKGALNFDDKGMNSVWCHINCSNVHDIPVPVYDGRGGKFNMQALKNMALRRWEDDITGQLCLVGYTANTWMDKQENKHLSLNIHWAVVLASA